MNKLLICFIIVGLAGCRKKEAPDPISLSAREIALASIGQNTATIGLVDFQTSVNNLRASITSYTNDPSNADKLYQLHNLYLWTALSWKQVATFTFGPIDQQFVLSNVYGPIDPSAIENAISKKGNIVDSTYMSTLGPGYRGLVAIEYLIYGTNKLDNKEVIAAFSDENKQRVEYLRALGNDLQNNADLMAVAWSRGGKGYVGTFASATGDDRNSSLALLVDGMVRQLARLKDESIGLPMGLKNGGIPQPELVDGKYSNKSIDLLLAEIKGITKIFIGSNVPGGDGKGIIHLLDDANVQYNNDTLSSLISKQIIKVNESAVAIGIPLSEAVESKKADVNNLYVELNKFKTMIDVGVRKGMNLK